MKGNCHGNNSKSRPKISVVRAIESFVDTIMYSYNVVINLYVSSVKLVTSVKVSLFPASSFLT